MLLTFSNFLELWKNLQGCLTFSDGDDDDDDDDDNDDT